uniref:BED-type domain-containing protein n=1 Tax=Arundo donax TaxID=35708 RepID=A0A0A9F590_ARUDO
MEKEDEDAAAGAAAASEEEEVVPIGAQKHDPAWKHCLMVRSEGRVRLKCAYCGKHFLGGGIHRFKEHLARRPGNACCCAKVPRDVQDTMLRSLDAVAAKKMQRKRSASLASAADVRRFADAPPSASNGTESPIHMISLNEVLDFEPVPLNERPSDTTDVRARGSVSKKKRKTALSQAFTPPITPQSQQQPLQPSTPRTNPLNQVVMSVDAVTPSPLGPSALDKEQVSMAIGRFLYDAGVPLEAVNSVYFQPMLDAIASAGGRLEALSYHDFRGRILKKSLDDVTAQLEFFKGSWTRTGCTVLADEWTTDKGRTLMNFSVYCPEGTMFLKSVDATSIVASSDALFELLKSIVEEVGEKKVIQVITSNTEIHAAAGKRLGETFPTLFWSPCTFQCIDGMLEDFSKSGAINEIIGNAKAIMGFVYNSAFALNLMKKYLNGKDLLVPAETRAATSFVTLKNMYSLKETLQAMVNSDEWIHYLLPKKGGIEVSNLVSNMQFWSSCAAVIRITEPLVHLLKLVGSNKRPAMGYVYAGLYQAKAAIKKELVRKNDYMAYWNIIDWRWDNHTPRPLHSAGFFLNPLFFDGIRGDISNGIFSGMLDCIERLVSDVKIQDKIQRELNMYRSEAAGDFRRQMAVRSRRTLPPAEWWYTYGGTCPNLTRLAVRILSQTCSAKGCDRSHIPFEQIHDESLSSFERQRMHHLTFVQYNLRLQQRQQRKAKAFDPVSVDYIDIVDDWVMDRTALFPGPAEQPNWMEIIQPVIRTTSWEPNEDEFESFIEGVDDEMIQGAAQGIQEDDDDPACG